MTPETIINLLRAEAIYYSSQARIAKRRKTTNEFNSKALAFDLVIKFLERTLMDDVRFKGTRVNDT